jgi:uncharacterized protein YaaW (UPF0174 family)
MAYKTDKHLEFLGYCNDESLQPLLQTLIKDTDGDSRWTESLTQSDNYKKHYPQHSQYWEEIASELQHFGGNTIANTWRGHGVEYREILLEVCDKMKVNYNKKSEVSKIEMNLLLKIMEEAMEEMSEEELKTIADELNLKTTSFTANAMSIALQVAIRNSGFMAYRVAMIVANAIAKALFGKGLTFAANRTITQTMAIFAGPIGWTITGVWTAVDIAGPAFRVTIPSVIQIAYLRQMQLAKETESE